MSIINCCNRFFYFLGFTISRNSITQLLLLSCLFSLLLLAVRISVTGSLFYLFLVWNLFLAFVPFFITTYIERRSLYGKMFWIFFTAWLLFIPNSFYIITDLFHLDEGNKAPQWFDLALLFSFAWNGLLVGIISLRKMEHLLSDYFSTRLKTIFQYVVLFLNGLGIYIGRYLRYNSWDIIANPFQLMKDILYLCIHPLRNLNDWGMIICFSMLLSFIYYGFKSMSHDGR